MYMNILSLILLNFSTALTPAGHKISIGKSHIQISSANKLYYLQMKWKSKRMALFSLPQVSEKTGHCLILKGLGIIRHSRCNGRNPLL